jgi:ketosteroid isomerase-like protein
MRKANLLLLATVSVYLLAAAPRVLAQGSAEQSIKALNEQLTTAALKGDAATYDKLTADDYTSISVLGRTSNRSQILADIKSGKTKFDSIEVVESKIRVYGDAALVIALANVKGHSGDADISGQYRSTRLWIKRKGEWKTVSFQATRVAQ